MQYFISFLEGVVTFISPCLLPMLPVYIFYFAGGSRGNTAKALSNSLGFVAGFTLMFVAMGALAGTFGGLLGRYSTAVNIVTGLIVVYFGLEYLDVPGFKLFKGRGFSGNIGNDMGFFAAFLFGIVFSVGWTPCVGVFLGSALAMASRQGSALKGIVMLLFYSLGLGIPFVVCAVFIDRLKGTFGFIKKNYRTVNLVCGIMLIAVGIMMMTGILEGLMKNISMGINV